MRPAAVGSGQLIGLEGVAGSQAVTAFHQVDVTLGKAHRRQFRRELSAAFHKLS